jgi:hypothetical protein
MSADISQNSPVVAEVRPGDFGVSGGGGNPIPGPSNGSRCQSLVGPADLLYGHGFSAGEQSELAWNFALANLKELPAKDEELSRNGRAVDGGFSEST